MSNLSTFGTFTMARLGIYVSQQALNITGNNIANINTDGYTRESLEQISMHYGGGDRYISELAIRENGGVLATDVNQLRDQYLDIRYRNETTKVGEMEARLKGLNQLGEVFDEVAEGEEGEGVLEARFNDFVQQLENLSQPQNVGTDGADALVREAAEAITVQFNDYARKLATIEENVRAEFHDNIESVNTILDKIRDLSTSIRKSDIFGGNALIQRDERNVLIDDLSKQIGISVTYEMEDIGDGREIEKMIIKTSGEPQRTLVDGVYAAQISIAQKGGDKPVAGSNPAAYTKQSTDGDRLELVISELTDIKGNGDLRAPNQLTDMIGSFETVGKDSEASATIFTTQRAAENAAALLNRTVENGGENSTYTVNPNDPDKQYYYEAVQNTDKTGWVIRQHSMAPADTGDAEKVSANKHYNYAIVSVLRGTTLNDTELSGGLQAMRELLTEEGEYADEDDLAVDENAGVKRGIPYYRQALDTLAREFAKRMNEANTMDPTLIYSNVARVGDDGKYYGEDDKVVTDPVLKQEYSYYNGGALFTDRGDSQGKAEADASNITAANISIAYDWSHGKTRVLRSKEENAQLRSSEQSNIDHFITLMTSEQKFVFGVPEEGRTYFKGTFQEMLTDTIAGTLAKDQNITKSMLGNYTSTADELYLNRDSVMGVDLNDEAMNMMMFQKAYSAACRLMTTYDGMLEKLINGTAV